MNISVHPRFVLEIVYWTSQFTLGLLWRSFIEHLSSPLGLLWSIEHLSSPSVCCGDRLLSITVHPRFVVEIVYWASQFTLGLLWRSFIEPLSSPSVCCGDRFSQSLVFCVVFCGPLSVFFALSLFLLFRNSDCYFGIFIPFYQQYLLKSTLLF